mgnify:CR=1 FL=1
MRQKKGYKRKIKKGEKCGKWLQKSNKTRQKNDYTKNFEKKNAKRSTKIGEKRQKGDETFDEKKRLRKTHKETTKE